MDTVTRKIAYIWLKFTEVLIHGIVWFYATLLRKRKPTTEISSIGAYWYYPSDLTGSNLRLGKWKTFFENDGFQFTNLHINKFKEYVDKVENGTWTSRYTYFATCMWRRLPQLLKAHQFDTIWIDRGLIPYYPKKTAFLEKQLRKVVSKLVVDSTDGGDYQANPQLMEDTFHQANELTVGYKHLKEVYSNRFKVTQIFWTIPTEGYIRKTEYTLKDPLVIGWMGSPGNFEHVLGIKEELRELTKNYNFVFRYICRKNFDEQLEGINCEHHYFGDDYYQILSSFDIGISPFLKHDLRAMGKIAMKHQEFLLMGTPQICSPVAISEFVEHKKNVFICSHSNEWAHALSELLTQHRLREDMGRNSCRLFDQYYTYPSQYDKLKTVLTNL